MKHIKNLLAHKYLYLWLAEIWTILIFFLCLVSVGNLPSVKVSGLDKLVHFTFHFVFVLLWFLYFKNRNIKSILVKIVLASFSYGIFIEMCQSLFTTSRKADVLDVLANSTGALVALVVIIFYNNFLKKDII